MESIQWDGCVDVETVAIFDRKTCFLGQTPTAHSYGFCRLLPNGDFVPSDGVFEFRMWKMKF